MRLEDIIGSIPEKPTESDGKWVALENAMVVLEDRLSYENDKPGFIFWLIWLSARVNTYIEHNLINGPEKEKHINRLSRFMVAADRVADWALLKEDPEGTPIHYMRKAYIRVKNVIKWPILSS